MKKMENRLAEVEPSAAPEGREWKGNVIIFPGGGYQWHSPREAEPVAKAFGTAGWKPWILYYPVMEQENDGTCPSLVSLCCGEKTAGTCQDLAPLRCETEAAGTYLGLEPLRCGAEAMKQVRAAVPGKPVVVCGFSAGGHAAASLGVHWNDGGIFTEDEQVLIRPDALVLCYPVITSGPWAHRGSIEMLAGEDGNLAGYFSLENFVNQQTPPTFLWHTAADGSVPVQNSLLFAESLAKAKVPFELHIYPRGEHGLSLATKEVEEPAKGRLADAHVAGWFGQCLEWLDSISVDFGLH